MSDCKSLYSKNTFTLCIRLFANQIKQYSVWTVAVGLNAFIYSPLCTALRLSGLLLDSKSVSRCKNKYTHVDHQVVIVPPVKQRIKCFYNNSL